jgi:hypothetical protein
MIKQYIKIFNENEFNIKIYSKFDENSWKLFLVCFKYIFREVEKKIFEWYFIKKNTFTILANSKKNYIGIYGLLDININFSGKYISSYLCHNVGVSKEYSGKGLFQYLGDKALSFNINSNNLVLGFPNKASIKGHLRLGWESIGEIYFIKYEGCNNEIMLDKRLKFETIDKFDNINFYNNEFSLNILKNNEYLNWRISKPNEHYIKYIIKENETIKGYCIYKIFQNEKIRKLHLVDFNFSNIDILNEIIKFSILKFRSSNCQLFNTWIVKNTIFEKELQEYGFIREVEMPSYPIIIFQKENKFNLSKIDKRKIFFTLFDNDVF